MVSEAIGGDSYIEMKEGMETIKAQMTFRYELPRFYVYNPVLSMYDKFL